MHGLINRAIQCFLRDTAGPDRWQVIAHASGVDETGFEAMLTYDDAVTVRMLDAASSSLCKSREALLEDLGTYLLSSPNVEALRRLLRFGGETFADFLSSIDDLPRRAKLAVPELDLPVLEMVEEGPDSATVLCKWTHAGFGHVLVGILRTMADDYGALVLLGHSAGRSDGVERVEIRILQRSFTAGRPFALAQHAR